MSFLQSYGRPLYKQYKSYSSAPLFGVSPFGDCVVPCWLEQSQVSGISWYLSLPVLGSIKLSFCHSGRTKMVSPCGLFRGFVFSVLGFELRPSCLWGRCSTPEPLLQPCMLWSFWDSLVLCPGWPGLQSKFMLLTITGIAGCVLPP
jgi:hypothetical protein